MGKQIKLSEEELHNLINSKIKEAVEKMTDLGYSPAIGNKKRGPGDEIEDQMTKRKNKKMDESFDEAPIYRRLPGGETDYEGEDSASSGKKTIELTDDDYAFAFEQIYGRVPGDLSDVLEEYNLPFEIGIKFSLNMVDEPGTYDTPGYSETSISDWDIDDEVMNSFTNELREIIRKAAESAVENLDTEDLRDNLYESKVVRLTLSEMQKLIKESIGSVMNEMQLKEWYNLTPTEVERREKDRDEEDKRRGMEMDRQTELSKKAKEFFKQKEKNI